MHYRETLPRPSLRSHVRCIWLLTGSADDPGAGVEQVIPDGCGEIILNRADHFCRLQDGETRAQAEVLLVGQIGTSISIAPSGAIDLLGVRFEPGGLHAVLGVPMHELTDLDLSLDCISRRLHASLSAACEPGLVADRIRAVEEAITCELRARAQTLRSNFGLIAAAVQRIESRPGTTEMVSAELGVSRRSLERSFRREVGLSPKHYSRVRRLQSVLRLLDEGQPPHGWASLAAGCGYADQSHLIRDFRLLAGTTPERYLAQRTAIGGFLQIEDVSHSSNPWPADGG